MTCTESYKEHIMYTFHGFCKVVIRNAAITAWRDQQRRHKREISLEYLTEENREIIFLYFFGNYRQWEIGEMYGRCRSTTGYQIHRTLKLLRKEMEVLSHGESESYPL